MVLLGDGSVLVVGDDGWFPEQDGAYGASESAEVLSMSSNRWSATKDLSAPRARFVALPLPDGRALVTGGLDFRSGSHNSSPYQSYSSAWAYDPATGAWSRAGLMNEARADPAAAVLHDGRVLVVGGYYASRDAQATALPGVANPLAIVLARSIGSDSTPAAVLGDISPSLPEAPTLSSAELYDPVTNTWTRTGSMAVPRFGASAVTLTDGRVLVVSQRVVVEYSGASYTPYEIPIDERAFTTAEIYDPHDGRFRLAGTLPTPLVDGALVALADGGALLVGGRSDPYGRQDLPVATVLRFDPRTLAWSETGRLATARTKALAVRLTDGRVLAAGGYDAYGPTRTAELYDAATGTWTPAPLLPAPRAGGAAVLLRDGSVLVVGGVGPHQHDSPYPDPMNYVGLADAVRFIPAGS